MRRSPARAAALMLACSLAGGCAIVQGIGGMAQNYEYQKQIEVPPKYDGLSGKMVAVLVDVDLATTYEHPMLARQVAEGVATGIQQNVADVQVLDPRISMAWQYKRPGWNALPFGEMAKELNVDRVVYVDITEYRLNPPGNRYEWDGVCAANVHVIEADAIDPDTPIDEWVVVGKFPDMPGVGWESAPRDRVEAGLMLTFIRNAAWLFYTHLEPKYPDKFRNL